MKDINKILTFLLKPVHFLLIAVFSISIVFSLLTIIKTGIYGNFIFGVAYLLFFALLIYLVKKKLLLKISELKFIIIINILTLLFSILIIIYFKSPLIGDPLKYQEAFSKYYQR